MNYHCVSTSKGIIVSMEKTAGKVTAEPPVPTSAKRRTTIPIRVRARVK